jgi:hypothetical protein
LKELDTSGDGKIDAKEIIAGMQALQREKQKTRQLLLMVTVLGFLMCVLLAAICGLLFAVIELTKESKIGSDSIMLVKGKNDPVRVASTDFTVINGVLSTRDSRANQTCGGGVCPSKPIQVSEASQQMRFSSEIDDATLYELKHLRVEQGRSYVHFQVLAVARYVEAYSRHGTVVVIYTHLGEITLDGEAVSFHETLSGAFSRAGFTIDANGRRLLGVVEMLGLFKLIRSAANASGAGAGPGQLSTQLPIPPPVNYYAEVTEMDMCQNEQGASTHSCESDGRLVDWVTEVANGRKALVLREEQVSQTIGGRHWARTVQTKAQWPEQRMVKVQNESHTLTFQVYDGVRYHCALRQDDSLLAALAARRALDGSAAATGNISVQYLGFATVEGVYCRGFDVTTRSGEIETRLRIYEDYYRRRLFMLQVANLRWRFDVLTPINGEAANPVPPEDLDMDAIVAACDPPGRAAPPVLLEGRISDIVRPQPGWGAPSNESRRRAGPEDSDAIIMSMADYRAWREDAAAPAGPNTSSAGGGRRAVSAASCQRSGGAYTAFSFPSNAAFKSLPDLKARKGVKSGRRDPALSIVWESCNDEISLYLAGSAGMGCPTISGGIELAVSGLAAGRPVIGLEGSLLASINICSCPPLMLPSAVVPFCPTLSLSISAALERASLSEGRTCQIGTFPGGNVRMSGDLGLSVGWGVSVAFYASARMYVGFRCASQQPRGSRLKIGHRYEVSIVGNFLWYSKTWSLPIYPSSQSGCGTENNAITGSPEYIFKPSTSEYAFALFDFSSTCSKA